MTPALEWRTVTEPRAARDLLLSIQSFTCTTSRPKTPGGRSLPHPRPWEWEVQRHLRQMRQILKSGQLLVVGIDEEEIIAAAHLLFDQTATTLQAYIAVAAVSVQLRGKGGAVADELMSRVQTCAQEEAVRRNLPTVVVTGRIHVRNVASQRMATRCGLEPLQSPSSLSEYQDWSRRID